MPEKDYFVEFPKATPGTGDTVLYSTRAATRPAVAGAVQSGERSCKSIHGWFKANQDATVKVMGWDVVTAAWVVLNNDGAGDPALAANGAADMDVDFPGGDVQIVVNFPVAPTAWSVPSNWRLSNQTRST